MTRSNSLRHRRTAARATLHACVWTVAGAVGFAQTTVRASVGAGGAQASGISNSASVSLDGQRIAFASTASNLATTDANGTYDVFVRDRETGATILVSATAASSTTTAAGASTQPAISSDGRWVAFVSNASNLVSPSPIGAGSSVAWLRDLQSSQTMLVSKHLNGNASPVTMLSISANGRYVAYESSITDVVAGDTNAQADVFVFDRTNGTTLRASTDSSSAQANGACTGAAISPEGRYVAFASSAPNLPGANGSAQIYLKDLQTHSLTLVSKSTSGVASNNVCSAARVCSGGRYVAFHSWASNLVPNGPFNAGIYVRDLLTNQTERASCNDLGAGADNNSYNLDLSADGRFVVFQSAGSNLDVGASGSAYQVFLRDRKNSTTRTVSLNSLNQFAAAPGAIKPAISGDGRFVVFESDSTNLVSSDTNALTDVFLRDRKGTAPMTYGYAQKNSLGCSPAIGSSGNASASAATGFSITCNNVINNKTGLLFYSTQGASASAYLGGSIYCKPPTIRTLPQSSHGSAAGSDCSGHFAFDFNAWIHAGSDPMLGAGQEVWAQYWSRDPASSSTTNLSDAIVFTIGS